MRIVGKIAALFVGIVVLGCILAPPIHMALREILGSALGITYFLKVPFDRVLSRVLVLLALATLFLFRRWLRIEDCLRGSLRPPATWLTQAGAGFALGVFSLSLLVLAGWGWGAIGFHSAEISIVLTRLAKALATGLAVGCIEEIFFRGFVLQSLLKEVKVLWALLLSSAFYAVLHYFKAPEHVALEHLDWFAGFRTASSFLSPFTHVQAMIPGVIGLMLVGLVLGIAYVRSGALTLSIGLHAGWVFFLKSYRCIASSAGGPSILFGDDKLFSGVAAWIVLGLMAWLFWRFIPARPGLAKS